MRTGPSAVGTTENVSFGLQSRRLQPWAVAWASDTMRVVSWTWEEAQRKTKFMG